MLIPILRQRRKLASLYSSHFLPHIVPYTVMGIDLRLPQTIKCIRY